jgi:ABC-type glycerol-3-phosphate transport system substrate-binding protein
MRIIRSGFDPLIFTFLFGGNIFDRLPDPTLIVLNRPENVVAVKWYASLTTQFGVTPKDSTIGGSTVRADTATLVEVNKCALWLGYYADLKAGIWGANNENRPKMLPLPTGKVKVSMVYMDGYFISAKARNALAAWDWINYLIGQPEAAGTMIPPRLSQVQAETFQKSAGMDAAAVANNLPAKIVVFSQNLGDYQLLRQAFESYNGVINAVIQGQADAQTALDQMQKAIDQGN